ncbi:lysozyme inhibitor LprI family protein [Oharaeibacter diazotrophicus]|uniref:Uncharacterized protein YecT (DUF1311 family) n=1 Tax=Oharaeibacter diazotrophicus TaxID=1920512 RepID=A0A4R6RGL5_9HYPH|nr:lysozyme inhibitor LprI family protein [Oharaeibacter diazotrophicus]TDP85581.1 uncharacterized protein YecT (DUF1311 family) [Oharaeibacter diazotrophicus]BBE74552.1 hypothetical protein OHA_1_04183 [Pleomorphomonas sp. SM30]GLS75749.1 hypothetical protein GCM10007904_10840 [Oharaeibacter diazotrophicus]
MTRTAALLLALALATPAAAGAREDVDAVEATEKACMAKAGSDPEYADCEATAHADADAVLNAAYKVIVGELPTNTGDASIDAENGETLRRLKAAQRAWVAFRDAECDLEGAEMLGGTGENLMIEGCLFQLTVDRVRALADRFDSGR